jgi:deazaflavin-dependent oxidoreductase (nitroreductase family)
MEPQIIQALERGGIADITTTGRRSGQPRRIEIFFHNFDGEIYIGGRPGRKRDWLANLVAQPQFTLHLKRGIKADLPAHAEEITAPDERATLLFRMLTESWNSDPAKARASLDEWVESSPLVKVTVES